MKKTLILIALSALWASCHICDADCEAKLKKYDAITKRYGDQGGNDSFANRIAPYLITADTADTLVKRYRSSVNIDSIRNSPDSNNLPHMAFIISKYTLNYILNTNQNKDSVQADSVIFYLAKTADNKITLIYDGIKNIPGTDSFYEVYYTSPSMPDKNSKMVFENVWPCPTCNLEKDHNTQSKRYPINK